MIRRARCCRTERPPRWPTSWLCRNARPSASAPLQKVIRKRIRMDERTANALSLLPDYLAQHVLLSLVALGLAILIGLPVAVVATRHRGLRIAALAGASLVQ